ncbi:class I SAM-dependent methyltransferase [Marinobacter xestospongiae]|uniref:Class I SAM-dependent methyltransferase n=1 Tax=Marinobacter xestospongiae TaxID=994319 RepID=A0ABU3VYB9_9GAMM|nr:class I SAM-dependent methyltransferase [Marinobacter xestospongiae]MDV2079171.1 class I SAM-dependent methyltransferase [Marinobacter xestospongiae]
MKESKAFWDKAAARYARSPVKDEASYQKKLAITREYLKPDWSVLEFGCGTGSTALAHAPFVREIVATDISDAMIEIATAKATEAGITNVHFQQGTLNQPDLTPNRFDAVLGLNILHLLEDLPAVLATIHRLLKSGGVFVSSTALVSEINPVWRLAIPVMQRVGLAPYVNRLGRQDLLRALATAGFEVDYDWQPGKESVFIVARKV